MDICITTDFKELEHVCLLAEVLAKRKETSLRVLTSLHFGVDTIEQMGCNGSSVSLMPRFRL